jgi:flagellin-specific chaperone FliS
MKNKLDRIEEAIEEFINILDVENKKDILNYTVDLYKRCLV